MILLVSSMALALQGAEPSDYKAVSNTEMETRLRDCGFEQITTKYDETIQSNAVTVADKEASDEQIKCAAQAIDLTFHTPIFSSELSERFHAEAEALARPRARAIAKGFFSQKPELGEVPMLAKGESELDFAKRLENFCSPQAKGAFTLEFGRLAISPAWSERQIDNFRESSEIFACLMYAAILNDMEVGLIGNGIADEADLTSD